MNVCIYYNIFFVVTKLPFISTHTYFGTQNNVKQSILTSAGSPPEKKRGYINRNRARDWTTKWQTTWHMHGKSLKETAKLQKRLQETSTSRLAPESQSVNVVTKMYFVTEYGICTRRLLPVSQVGVGSIFRSIDANQGGE